MYYGMGGGYEAVAICCSLLLSATTILMFIFVPKVYIVLFKPEKNLKSNSRLRSRTKSTEYGGNDVINSESAGIEYIFNIYLLVCFNSVSGKQDFMIARDLSMLEMKNISQSCGNCGLESYLKN
jgi:hypothetical protein